MSPASEEETRGYYHIITEGVFSCNPARLLQESSVPSKPGIPPPKPSGSGTFWAPGPQGNRSPLIFHCLRWTLSQGLFSKRPLFPIMAYIRRRSSHEQKHFGPHARKMNQARSWGKLVLSAGQKSAFLSGVVAQKPTRQFSLEWWGKRDARRHAYAIFMSMVMANKMLQVTSLPPESIFAILSDVLAEVGC